MQSSGVLKQNCSLDKESVAAKACLYNFSVNNIVDRKGALFGFEIKSTWLEEQLAYRPLPHYYLTHINELESMLASLGVCLKQDCNLKLKNGQIFLDLDRIYLLDSGIVKVLLSLAAILRSLEMEVVIMLNSRSEGLCLYTLQVKYLLRDAGVKFCHQYRFDEKLQSTYPFDYLMFDSLDLAKAMDQQRDSEIVDALFVMKEKGFMLILAGISDATSYSTGFSLPFSCFQSLQS